jgi:hypothetical protein
MQLRAAQTRAASSLGIGRLEQHVPRALSGHVVGGAAGLKKRLLCRNPQTETL